MILHAETKRQPRIEKAVSKDKTRPALCGVQLDAESETEGFLVATDSYKLVAIPVEAEGREKLVSGVVPSDAFKALKKDERVTLRTAKGKATAEVGGVEWPLDTDSKPVSWRQLIPEEENVSSFRLGINAQYLKDVADAMGTETVLLEFITAQLTACEVDGRAYRLPANTRAIRVRPLGPPVGGGATVAEGPVGVIMPVRLS